MQVKDQVRICVAYATPQVTPIEMFLVHRICVAYASSLCDQYAPPPAGRQEEVIAGKVTLEVAYATHMRWMMRWVAYATHMRVGQPVELDPPVGELDGLARRPNFCNSHMRRICELGETRICVEYASNRFNRN